MGRDDKNTVVILSSNRAFMYTVGMYMLSITLMYIHTHFFAPFSAMHCSIEIIKRYLLMYPPYNTKGLFHQSFNVIG